MKKTKPENKKPETVKLASSPCAIDDVDPDYMGLTNLKKKQPVKTSPKKED